MSQQNEIKFQFYPKHQPLPEHLNELVKVFSKNIDKISSFTDGKALESDDVLAQIANDLLKMGYKVELNKRQKIPVPVLYGENNIVEKHFDVDAYDEKNAVVLEVEAGCAVSNNHYVKDIFKYCVMDNIQYGVIAVRQLYRRAKDYNSVIKSVNTIYSSDRFKLPLKGLLIIGY